MSTLKTTGIKRRPVNLFFTEIIIALLFFSISGAVIVKVFAAADRRSRLNAEKEHAMICAQSIAEVYSEQGNAQSALKTVFSESAKLDESSGELTIRLDGSYRPALDGKIVLRASEHRGKTAAGELSRLSISFESDNNELYSLECTAYTSENRAEDNSNGGDIDA